MPLPGFYFLSCPPHSRDYRYCEAIGERFETLSRKSALRNSYNPTSSYCASLYFRVEVRRYTFLLGSFVRSPKYSTFLMKKHKSKHKRNRVQNAYNTGMKRFKRPLRWIFTSFLVLSVAGLLSVAGFYVVYSKDLPTNDKILNWHSDESTRIFDRNGKLLYEIYDEEKRVIVPSESLNENLKEATVAIEDSRFYSHNGLDVKGIARAAYVNVKRGKTTEGGSTITQQLAKNAFLSNKRTVTRKIKELILAVKIEQNYSKDQILTMYLNEVGYGSNAYGAEAASQMYFGKSAKDLNLQEAATLAALTKSPSTLSPYGPNANQLIARRNFVLDRMADLGFTSREEADKAKQEKLAVRQRQEFIQAPHFVMYVKQLLIDKFGEDAVERGGLQVTTSLDLDKQKQVEEIINQSNDHLKKAGATNAAVVSLDPKTGDIITMVGSKDYFDSKNDGNVNVATSHRPPGSAFKPVVYAEAFEKGPWAPGSTLFDLETDFGTDKKNYIPKNYDGKFHGPVSIRTALANSYNVPAVKMMALLGKDETINTAKKLGISTLTDTNNYGLSLVIGGGDIKLIELAGAYGSFANNGMFNQPNALLKVAQHDKTLYEYKPDPKLAFRPETAYEISSILSDNEARKTVFGPNSPLHIPGRTAAAKTGTTQDYRDAWTMGYTPSLVVGVWVGNNDFRPMKTGSAGAMAAAPIWNKVVTTLLNGKPNEDFVAPGSIQLAKVDAISGKKPTNGTRETREDIFAPWQMPGDVQLANFKVIGCDGNVKGYKSTLQVHSEKPDDARWEKPVIAWARANGYATGNWGGDVKETCESPSPQPEVANEPEPSPNPESTPEGVGGAPDNEVHPVVPSPVTTPSPEPSHTPGSKKDKD